MEYRLHHRLSKFDRSVFLNLKPISYMFVVECLCFLSRNYWGFVRSWSDRFEKKPFQFGQEIWIQVVVILLQLYVRSPFEHKRLLLFAKNAKNLVKVVKTTQISQRNERHTFLWIASAELFSRLEKLDFLRKKNSNLEMVVVLQNKQFFKIM